MTKVDLNCDLGESFGAYTIGMDEDIIGRVSSLNIACGWHAGDPMVMRKTLSLVKSAGTQPGAHPGYPDLMGFGRRSMNISAKEAYAYVLYQLGALGAFAAAQGMRLQHIKPHGALYNTAGRSQELAEGIIAAARDYDKDIIILGLAGSEMVKAAESAGLRTANEFFADRAYEADGSLVARTKPGAMITDPDAAIDRVIQAVSRGSVTTIDGQTIPLKCDSVCVHGDNAHALEFVDKIRARLTAEGIAIAPLCEIV